MQENSLLDAAFKRFLQLKKYFLFPLLLNVFCWVAIARGEQRTYLTFALLGFVVVSALFLVAEVLAQRIKNEVPLSSLEKNLLTALLIINSCWLLYFGFLFLDRFFYEDWIFCWLGYLPVHFYLHHKSLQSWSFYAKKIDFLRTFYSLLPEIVKTNIRSVRKVVLVSVAINLPPCLILTIFGIDSQGLLFTINFLALLAAIPVLFGYLLSVLLTVRHHTFLKYLNYFFLVANGLLIVGTIALTLIESGFVFSYLATFIYLVAGIYTWSQTFLMSKHYKEQKRYGSDHLLDDNMEEYL